MTVRTFARRLLTWTLRFAALAAILLAVAVPAAWIGIPRIAATSWARQKVESALTRAVRAPVTVERMEFCWKDGLRLLQVRIPPTPEGPFEVSVRAPEARVSLSRRPRVTLFAPDIRLAARTEPAAPARSKVSYRLDRVEVRDATVLFEDPAFAGALRIEDLDGRLAISGRRADLSLSLQGFACRANGGSLRGSFALQRASKHVSVRADLKGVGIASNDLLARLARGAAPVLESADRGDDYGSLSFTLQGSGSGAGLKDLISKATAEGSLAVREAALSAGKATSGRVVREIDGTFALLRGKLLHPSLEVRMASSETWRLMGWTTSDGRIDYAVRPSTGAVFSISGTLDAPRVE